MGFKCGPRGDYVAHCCWVEVRLVENCGVVACSVEEWAAGEVEEDVVCVKIAPCGE